MLELYHNDMSVCAQKVRLLLAEKEISWVDHHMSLRQKQHTAPDYLKLNPNGVVPTLVDDGRTIIDSTIINEYIEDKFTETSFRPISSYERALMRKWTKQLDDSIHAATGIVTISIGIRNQYFELYDEQALDDVLKAVPNSKWRELKKQLIRNGLQHPDLPDALLRLQKMLADMEEVLQDGRWLAGDTYSLADIGLIPYVVRIDHLNFMELISAQRRVADWYDRMRARPAFDEAFLGGGTIRNISKICRETAGKPETK